MSRNKSYFAVVCGKLCLQSADDGEDRGIHCLVKYARCPQH